MKTTIQLAIVSILLLTACKKNGSGVTQSLEPRYSSSTNNARSNSNAQQGIELMYYDSMLVQMKLNQFAIRPSRSFLVHSQPLNSLYMANGYATVIDAIQGESYRAIWREVDIVFNIDENEWQGNKNLQLKIIDIRLSKA